VTASLQRPGSVHRALSEINVTPFVDVALVLLIIFMVTAPMMQQGIDVDLPETTTQPLRVKDEPLILTVQKNGKYYLGRREIPAAELPEKLAAIFEGRDTKEIFLRADRDAPYGIVVKALAAARQAGATQLGMVTEPEP
jgi:biopolymer transport protein TolR